MANEPDKEEVLAQVRHVSDIVAATLVKAARSAGAFFVNGKPFSATVYADLTRYYAHQLFRVEQLESNDDDDLAMEAHAVANLGLELYSNGVLFKVLKFGKDYTVPVPQTEARVDFYNQQLSAAPDRMNTLRPVELNLLYLWEYDSELEASRLMLVCPKAGSRKATDVALHFSEEIALPKIARSMPSREPEDRTDLDITRATSANDDDLGIVDPRLETRETQEDESEPGNN
jgi:hypothetical protein